MGDYKKKTDRYYYKTKQHTYVHHIDLFLLAYY